MAHFPDPARKSDVDRAELVAGVNCMVGGQVSKMLTCAKQLAKLPSHQPHNEHSSWWQLTCLLLA